MEFLNFVGGMIASYQVATAESDFALARTVLFAVPHRKTATIWSIRSPVRQRRAGRRGREPRRAGPGTLLHAAAAVQNLDELNAWLLDKCIA
jgi:hypothetical protein